MNAFVYIPLLAATWAIAFAFAITAAHYFLVVIDSSAAGSDKIVWPDEPMIDWFYKVFYLAWLGGAWIGPLIVIGRLVSTDPGMRFIFTAGSFWLLFPFGMLSSLSANSPWMPFSLRLFSRLSQRFGAVVVFYILSIPISLAFVGSFHALFMRPETPTLYVAIIAPVGAASYLIYARALGRLGLVLSFTKGAVNEPSRRKRKRKKNAERKDTVEHDEQPRFKQPSELPPIETPFEGAITGYDVQFDEKHSTPEAPRASRMQPDEDEDLTPFEMTGEEPDPNTAKKEQPPPAPTSADLEVWQKSERVQEPAHPFNSSLFGFLFEPRTASSWLILTAGLALLGLMIQLLRELRPV